MELKTDKIKFLIIHHSATNRDRTSFQAVKNYHISLGWGDIGYHYFITGDGKIWQGRKENVIGAHCVANSMNFQSLGICLTGNFMTEKPSEAQIKSLNCLLMVLMARFNITKENIFGHRQVKGAATLCPGDNLQQWIFDKKK